MGRKTDEKNNRQIRAGFVSDYVFGIDGRMQLIFKKHG